MLIVTSANLKADHGSVLLLICSCLSDIRILSFVNDAIVLTEKQ